MSVPRNDDPWVFEMIGGGASIVGGLIEAAIVLGAGVAALWLLVRFVGAAWHA